MTDNLNQIIEDLLQTCSKVEVLDERPYDPIDRYEYLALLTKPKQKSWYAQYEWGIKIIVNHKGQWKLTSGQWLGSKYCRCY